MNRIFKWIKEHVRLYIKPVDKDDSNISVIADDSNRHESVEEKLEDVEKNTEVGVKISFKF